MPQLTQPTTTDDMFAVLSHSHRRHILSELSARTSSRDPAVEVDTLVPADQHANDSIETQFHHVQLPKLADHEFITWDRANGTVRRGPAFAAVEPVIERFEKDDELLPGEW